ncbi:MAG TPA: low affinity iron permease family protein [Noviherbaspirillum sp.]
MNDAFRKFAHITANIVGSSWAFFISIMVVAAWLTTGPLYHYSDTWQLVINTATSIVTFLMVFIIQNSQNRDAKAMQLKLDELLRAVEGARTGLVNLESLSDEDLLQLQHEFERLGKRINGGQPAADKRQK